MSQIFGRIYYGWLIVAAAFVTMFVGLGVSFYTFGIFLKALSEEFGWNRGEISLAFLFFSAGLGGASPLVGRWTDKYGPKRILIPAAFLMGLCFVSLRFLTASLVHLYFVYFLTGCSAVAVVMIVPVTMVSHWFRKKRGLALGITYVGGGFGGVFLAPLTSRLVSEMGFRDAYMILGMIIWAIIFFLVVPVIKSSPGDIGLLPDGEVPGSVEKNPTKGFPRVIDSIGTEVQMNFKQARKTLNFWLLISALFLTSFGISSVNQHLVPLLTDKGLSLDSAVRILSFFAAASILGRLISGYVVDKLVSKYVVIAFYAAFALGTTLLIFGDTNQAIYLATLFLGLALGAEFDLMAYIVGEYFGFPSFGEIFSYIFIAFVVGAAIGAPVFGYVFDITHSYNPVLLICVFLAFLAIIAIYLLEPPGVSTSGKG